MLGFLSPYWYTGMIRNTHVSIVVYILTHDKLSYIILLKLTYTSHEKGEDYYEKESFTDVCFNDFNG